MRYTVVLIAAVALAVISSTSAAVASPLVPPGFHLQASNGYRIFGLFFDGTPHQERDELILIVARKGASALYVAPANADETSVVAKLGALGTVDLHFVPTGRPKSEPTPCGMPKQIEVESGKYEGTIEFRGEGGFATARASRAAADAHVLLGLVCGESGSEGSGGHSPGARLTIHHDGPAERTEFVVRKNSPTRVARFAASIEERRGRIGIERQISSTAAPATFRFAFPAKTAVVRPGAPFHGAALYNGDRGKFNRVGGGLTADFPGHSGVHLVGPHTSASMVRYVDNPSHPFDLPGADVFSLPRLGAWLSTKP